MKRKFASDGARTHALIRAVGLKPTSLTNSDTDAREQKQVLFEATLAGVEPAISGWHRVKHVSP